MEGDKIESNRVFVCAFRGRRDDYQVPLALAETGKLDEFITDFYLTGSVASATTLLRSAVRARVSSREKKGIPRTRVKCLWGTTLLELLRLRTGRSARHIYAEFDRKYSRAARDRARKSQSSLLLYSPYAWEAFTAHYRHELSRILFQFHAHLDFERHALSEDVKLHPEVVKSYMEETAAYSSEELARRERDVWKYADVIICASSFTRRTLVEAGANPAICKLVPYGVDLPEAGVREPTPSGFRVLFVGSGVQRKGLHHLIAAWKAARLPIESRLDLVCRNIDPGIARLVGDNKTIRLHAAISREQLANLYRTSSLFAMPSLVEGFGQVFLEALAQGCPVLGTPHTCLPDIGTEDDGVFLCGPGNVEELIAMLERLSATLVGDIEIRRRARTCAAKFCWPRFRSDLVKFLPA